MFSSPEKATVIADGLRIEGNVYADGDVELNGLVEGEVHCKSLTISPAGRVEGKVMAEVVRANGAVVGPIHGKQVVLEPKADVTGDVHHESLAISEGAFFSGRSVQKGEAVKAKQEASEAKAKAAKGKNGAANKEMSAAAEATH
jgi:cytoskeletal protein CcmA (bactofilin family)